VKSELEETEDGDDRGGRRHLPSSSNGFAVVEVLWLYPYASLLTGSIPYGKRIRCRAARCPFEHFEIRVSVLRFELARISK
jgi:hypothetical protein